MIHKYRTRVQGESLQSKIRELEQKVFETLWYPTCFVALTVWAWLAYAGLMKFDLTLAIIITAVAVFLAIKGFFKIRKLMKTIRAYRKGLEGERLVGETINQLSDNVSTFVFHDIPGERFNVDHIIVSTRGIFVIETKHFDRTKCHEFFFDGNMVYRQMKDGRRFPCPKLLPQMDGEARFIQSEIEKRAEIKLPVTKVAILVGSYVHSDDNFKEYWLLNDAAFITAFNKCPEVFDDSIAKHVANHIRDMVKIDVDE